MLVTCNCKILKLYTSSHGSKYRKGHYKNLRELEGGRYGVLSVTNPNYLDDGSSITVGGNNSDISLISDNDKTNFAIDTSFVRMGYKEDNTDKNEFKEKINNTINAAGIVSGELSGCLAIDEVLRDPPIESV